MTKSKAENELKKLSESINKHVAEIERHFFLIGIDLLKAQMYVKAIGGNFKKWIEDNTKLDKSTAYKLIKLVKKDKELVNSKNYSSVKKQISLYKLIRLIK
ncbi:hypothetical protein ACFL5V_08850 [Fibrobacterota bacterium]